VRILFTGGSANGKSTFAEKLAAELPMPRYYVAAMRPYGEEGQKRIARHRAMRAEKGFETIEKYTDLSAIALPQGGTVLVECLCNLTANEIFDPDGAGENALEAVMRGLDHLAAQSENLLIVTNDVGSDGGGYSRETMEYVEILGKINRIEAEKAHRVYELVAGIPLLLKGEA